MKLAQFLNEQNAVIIVGALKKQLLRTLACQEREEVQSHHQQLLTLESLLEHVRNFMCGNFYHEAAKEIFDNFQLERELVEQEVLGLLIANLDRLSVRISRHLEQVFHHIISKYAYQTRRPLVEKLEGNPFLLRRLCRFLFHRSDTVSTVACEMLVACCEHMSLARKLVDLPNPVDQSGTSIFYLSLLHLVPSTTNPCQLAHTFKFLGAIFLSHHEVANYAFTRDLKPLIGAFNEIFSGKCHYYARFKCLCLFGQLIQNRKLHTFINVYTTDVDNLKLFYEWALSKNASPEFKEEFIKIFEIFRLFFLNTANQKNGEMKKFVESNHIEVTRIIDRAEKVRSYSDLALMYPEYNDVREQVDLMLGKQKKKPSRFGRFNSSDSI